jgi:hypothetical protein
VKVETTDTDWLPYRAEANRFEAAGGARNLTAMLRAFRDRAETSAPDADDADAQRSSRCLPAWDRRRVGCDPR